MKVLLEWKMSETYTAWVDTDIDGSLYIIIPEELIGELGWKVGENITWIDNKDGSYTLRKDNEV
jgi:bifunctional DNA-binding transcriptional regulator/antitoxin component of YhaV-PrlF toxin-antitoxin module